MTSIWQSIASLTHLLNANRFWLSVVIPVVSALAAIVAAYFAYDQAKFSKRLAHLHIKPQIECKIDLPKDTHPICLIVNNGDVPVFSFSVAHGTYVFDKSSGKITLCAKDGYLFRDELIFREEFKPNEYESFNLMSFNPANRVVAVHQFNLRYYVGKAMEKQDKDVWFFLYDGKVYEHSEFIKNLDYRKIMTDIPRAEMELEKTERKVKSTPGTLTKTLQILDNKKKPRKE